MTTREVLTVRSAPEVWTVPRADAGDRRPAQRHRTARGGLLRRRRLVGAARAGRALAADRATSSPCSASRPAWPPTSAGPPTRSPGRSACRWSRSITHEGDRAAYRANGPDRCFHCKDELFATISDEVVAAHRPRRRRVRGERRRRRPPRPARRPGGQRSSGAPAAGRGRADQGRRPRSPGSSDLPVADKPAAPCLASRIPHCQEVTPEKLRQIEQAETPVRALGLRRPPGPPPRRDRPARAAGR